MNSNLIVTPKVTSPDDIGANASAKGKKLTQCNIFIKYLNSPGKEIKDKNLANIFNPINSKLNKLLKKSIFKNKKPPSKDDIDFRELFQSVDLSKVDYSEYQNIFETISSNEMHLMSKDCLNNIFTQTKDANGIPPSTIEVFLYRFLIINIFNINSSIYNYSDQFLQLLQFLFNIPFYYIEEAIYLLSVIFNDLTNQINVHILNKSRPNSPSTNQFIEKLSILCINYLLDEILTNQKNFTIYEMQCFLQAHFVEQLVYFNSDSVSHLKHLISALTKVNIKLSNKDISFFYGPLIKSTSYFVKKSISQFSKQNQNGKDSLIISLIFFLMDKIFSISHELININNIKDLTLLIEYSKKIFDDLPADFAIFMDHVIETCKWTNSIQQENFTQFSQKEENLFNNDKDYKVTDSSIIESTNQNLPKLQQLIADIIRKDIRSIVEYSCISFNNDAAHLNKFIKQINNYENKMILIILLKELTNIILMQINENKTMKSAAKMLILINILLNLTTKDFSVYLNIMSPKNPDDPTFCETLLNIFVFDERFFYFSNPTLKSSVLYAFSSYDGNSNLFNIVDKQPADLELYENLRKSILSLFCNHLSTFSDVFIELITKKIDNSVQPQVSNFFISMLRLFYIIQPDLTINSIKSSLFFDTFSSKYLKGLRSYYIFYKKDPSKSYVADFVQAYRYNSVMLVVQFTQKPHHIQALFSSITAVDYFFNYGLFEEDYFSLDIEIIEQVFNSFETQSHEKAINYSQEADNIITTYITTLENCADSVKNSPNVKNLQEQDFNYSLYCLNVIHSILTIFGECVHFNPTVFANSLVNNFFPSIICGIPNKLLPIDNPTKMDIINDILYIICGLTKDNDEFKKRFVNSMKKQKLAQVLNSIELNDKTIKNLLMLIFEKEIDLNIFDNKNVSSDIKFNKALPFLHQALLNKRSYFKVFLMIYESCAKSLSNKIQIYKSKLLSLYIVEICKYPDFRKMTLEQQSNIDLMFNTFQAVTSCFCKPRTLLEVLITLQNKVNNQRPWYVAKFIKIFNIILNKNEENETSKGKSNSSSISTSFFHFSGNQTGISIPRFSIADKEGFTFVCRFQLDNDYINSSIPKPKLLSFSTNDNKIKLFFDRNVLSIKHKSIATKSKTKVTSDIEKVNYPFTPNLWYTMILKGFSNDKLELYVNSGDRPIHTLNLKHCIFDTINTFTVANSSLKKRKGLTCNVSVIYFFNRTLSSDRIKDLMALPIKFSYLFTPSNMYLYPDLPRSLFNDEKIDKSLIFCYNANMFDGQIAVNLVRGNENYANVKGLNVPYNSSFIGAITSLGGIKAFLPLLEIIDLVPFRNSNTEEDSKQLLTMILEIFISLNHLSTDFENEFCKSNGIQAFAHAFSNISKKDIDKFILPSLYKFYYSFKNEANQIIFLHTFWLNYNVWDKMTIEQHQSLLTICLKPILLTNDDIIRRNISYSFMIAMLKDIPDDNVRDIYFGFVEICSQHFFVKEDQKFLIHLAFTSEGVFQGQVLRTFYNIMIRGNECYNRLYGTNVYNNLVALSSSSNEETRIYVVKILFWFKVNIKKEPIPLNFAILSFIKTLNFENITDRSWIELEKIIFEENKGSDKIVELLPLFACYSHYTSASLVNNFIKKFFDISLKNHDLFKIILLSPNWVLNLFYIYMNSMKPVMDFSASHVFIDYIQNMFLYLISQNIDEYRNAMNELYLIQFVHHINMSLFIRQIFIAILQRKESESSSVYKVIIPDIFAFLFYIPTVNIGNDTIPILSTFDHSMNDLKWIDYILHFNYNCKSSSSRCSSNTISKSDSVDSSGIIHLSPNNNIKIKIDFSNIKGSVGMRITPEGKWEDALLGDALEKRFIGIMKALNGKQVDKLMTISGHNSYKLSISCFDFFTIIEMISVHINQTSFESAVSFLCHNFLKSSPSKKQTLQLICYLSSPIIDQNNTAEILFKYVKSEYPKEIDSFVKHEKKASPEEDAKNRLNEKSIQIKFFEYFYKGLDILELISNDCLNYFKNTKELSDLAKSAIEMIQQESHILSPRYKFVQQFTGSYPFIRLNLKNICLSAYKKISQEIIGYESACNEQTNLHWRISNRVDETCRRIYLKINNHFNYEKYKELSDSVTKNSMNTALQAISSSSMIKTESKKNLLDDEQESDDNDDDMNNLESVGNYFDDDEEGDSNKISQTASSAENNENSGSTKKQKENYLFSTKSVLIMVSKHFSGSFSIDRNKFVFVGKEMNSLMSSTAIPDKYLSSKKKPEEDEREKDENNLDTSSNTKTIQFLLSDIKWILLRSYLHVKEGFEVFLTNKKSYFFFLTEFNRSTVLNYFTKHRKDLPNCTVLQTSPEKAAQMLQDFKITEAWVSGRLSNYSYLLLLNLFAGRSFNDTTQYPVFPWILKEYNKDEIDLDDESIYRDLSKPILLLDQSKLEKAKETYAMVDDDEDKVHNFLFYSNDMNLSILMLRIEPFTTTYLNTQPNFDIDRFPSSIGKLFSAATEKNGFELIPEFFTTAEALVNNDKDIVVDNDSFKKVGLPNWVINKSPSDFIKKHRLALESDYVSRHLNEWIDLIFGFAQTGQEAINRCNTYPPKLYPRYLSRHKHQIREDPMIFQDVQNRACCFGIVPNKLFAEKHPRKMFKMSRGAFMNSGKFSNKLIEMPLNNPELPLLESQALSIASSSDNVNSSRNSSRPYPLFIEGNEQVTIILSSDSKLTVFPSKSSFVEVQKMGSARTASSSAMKIRKAATDLSSFILLKSRFDSSAQNVDPTSSSLSKRFCFLSNKLVVTSPWESEIRVFKIKANYFLELAMHSSGQECMIQSCLDLTTKKFESSVFSLYSAVQLHCMVLMTCRAGTHDFLTVSNDFSITKWCLHSKKDEGSGEMISNNNYEFGTAPAANESHDAVGGSKSSRLDRKTRKGSLPSFKVFSPIMNRVKMAYKIIPHSTKIVAIGASNHIDIIASCDKDKNLIVSRLSDGAFIRSFKTAHKVKSLLISETPCIVISLTSKNRNEVNNDDNSISMPLSNDAAAKYVTTIISYSINNSKNDNVHEEPIAERAFEKKFLTAWCNVDLCFGCDNYVACCFSDKSLMILSLPMLNVHYKANLSANATCAYFNRQYSVLAVTCVDGSTFNLKC